MEGTSLLQKAEDRVTLAMLIKAVRREE